MDAIFYLQQGNLLLEKKDYRSLKKAMNHFKKANELTEDNDLLKPKTLYYLAYGNYVIANVSTAYKIAIKAEKSLEPAMKNSIFSMNNMRGQIGGDLIDELIDYIENRHPFISSLVDPDSDIDENILDFTKLDELIGEPVEEKRSISLFERENITDDMLYAIFATLTANDDQRFYFDLEKGDVVSHTEGYFASLLDDQKTSNQDLARRIINNDLVDLVDEEKHIEIGRIQLVDFFKEFKILVEGFEFLEKFSKELENKLIFKFNLDKSKIGKVSFHRVVQDDIHAIFLEEFTNLDKNLKDTYSLLFENTCKSLALKWMEKNVLKN